MKFISKIFKKEKIDLLKCKEVKTYIKNHQEPFRFYKIDCPIKKEEDFFYFQSLVQTIENKETIEGAFIRVYDDMRDYWQTLTYEERKKLVNIEIHQKMKGLCFVPSGEKHNYLPHFDEKMNRIYEDEMVLFDLKQYNALRFDFKHLILVNGIHLDLIKNGFTSLLYVCGEENDFYAFCSLNHTLYHFVNQTIVDCVTLVGCNGNTDELKEFIDLVKLQDEQAICMMLEDKKWVSERSLRKIEKFLRKQGGI